MKTSRAKILLQKIKDDYHLNGKELNEANQLTIVEKIWDEAIEAAAEVAKIKYTGEVIISTPKVDKESILKLMNC